MFLQLSDPTTNKYIPLFSNEVINLLNNGYTIDKILNLAKQIPLEYNRTNIFSNDCLINYMLHLDVKDIKSLSMIDKNACTLLHNKYLWKLKIIDCINTFTKGNYIGDCTLQKYFNIHKIIANSNHVYNNLHKSIKFELTNENFYLFIDPTIELEDYDPASYKYQYITINPDQPNQVMLTSVLKQPISNVVSRIWYYQYKDIKILLFNLFYYYPKIKWHSLLLKKMIL